MLSILLYAALSLLFLYVSFSSSLSLSLPRSVSSLPHKLFDALLLSLSVPMLFVSSSLAWAGGSGFAWRLGGGTPFLSLEIIPPELSASGAFLVYPAAGLWALIPVALGAALAIFIRRDPSSLERLRSPA